MNNPRQTHLHPVENAQALESSFRRVFHNPQKIVGKYIQPGMTVLDLGCGTGYFTTEIARLLDNSGKVIAADVQEGMLQFLRNKLKDSELQGKIQIHKSPENTLGLTEKVDFVLVFYAFHEMKYIDNIMPELKTILQPEAKILITEQKFHVTKYMFNTFIQKMEDNGFIICKRPKIFLSRAVTMKLKN